MSQIYTIDVDMKLRCNIEVEADSPQEAVDKVRENNFFGGYDITGSEVVDIFNVQNEECDFEDDWI